MTDYVCPECGCETFIQRRIVATEVQVKVSSYGLEDEAEEILDRGDDDGEITCVDCGASYDGSPDELTPADEYASDNDA